MPRHSEKTQREREREQEKGREKWKRACVSTGNVNERWADELSD